MEYAKLEIRVNEDDVPPVAIVDTYAPVVGMGYQKRDTTMNFNMEEGWETDLATELDERFPDNVAPAP